MKRRAKTESCLTGDLFLEKVHSIRKNILDGISYRQLIKLINVAEEQEEQLNYTRL